MQITACHMLNIWYNKNIIKYIVTRNSSAARTVTEVVPSPTSSSWTLDISIRRMLLHQLYYLNIIYLLILKYHISINIETSYIYLNLILLEIIYRNWFGNRIPLPFINWYSAKQQAKTVQFILQAAWTGPSLSPTSSSHGH